MNMKSRQSGVSLIELLLWLAVVAAILITVGRFFKTENYSAQVTQAVTRVGNFSQGFSRYIRVVQPGQAMTSNGYTNSGQQWSSPDLYRLGFVSAEDVQTPWPVSKSSCGNRGTICGSISFTTNHQGDHSFDHYYITISKPPAALCSQLENQLTQNGYTIKKSCSGGSDTMVEYHLY